MIICKLYGNAKGESYDEVPSKPLWRLGLQNNREHHDKWHDK
jgi:hypothetical protein